MSEDELYDECNETLRCSDEEGCGDTETTVQSTDSVFGCRSSGSSLFVPNSQPSLLNERLNSRKRGARGAPVRQRLEKCSICGAKLGTSKGLEKHLLNHKFEEAARRKPSADQLRQKCLEDASKITSDMEKSPISTRISGNDFSIFAGTISNFANPEPTREFREFVEVCVEDLIGPLCSSKTVMPSSIRGKVRGLLHGALANADVRNKRLEKLVLIVNYEVTSGIPEQYLEEFCRKLSESVVYFMINLMRQAPDDEHVLRCSQKSKDDFDQLFSQQSLHNVVGYSVKAVLVKCRRFNKSQRYSKIQRLIFEKFAKIGTMEARPQERSFWTALLARKAYTFVSEAAFDYFVEVAKVLCYVETETGSIPTDEVLKIVSSSPVLVAQWDTLVGDSLSERDSFFLMRLLVSSLCGSFGRGIVLRRTNAQAEKTKQLVTSVGLRAQVTKVVKG